MTSNFGTNEISRVDTCVKSSTETIRRQALELLLRCPRKEGMWDSSSTVNLIQDFWNFEQQLIYRPSETYPVSEKLVQMSEVVDLVFNENMQWEWRLTGAPKIEPHQRLGGDDFLYLENWNWLSAETMDINLFGTADNGSVSNFSWP